MDEVQRAAVAAERKRWDAIEAAHTLRARMEPEQLWALAQFLKRLSRDEMIRCAIDADECALIFEAVELLRRGLAEIGVDPR